jgi:phosphatidylserine synthase
MDHARLQRIRNFQSQDWYPALVIRPLTIGIMLVIADWKFLTPNRLTTVANVAKLAGAWLILVPDHPVLAVVCLQLGVIFDHLDGTMARYSQTFTKLGSFYDKVSDMITWSAITLAAGWQTMRETGAPYYLLLASASALALSTRGYMKWLFQAETERVRWLEARPDPAAAVAKYTAPIVIKPPPVRTAADWAKWFGSQLLNVLKFEEMDLWFYLSVAILIGHLDWAMWLMFVTQLAGMAVLTVTRMVWIARVDRQIRTLEATDYLGSSATASGASGTAGSADAGAGARA